MPLLLLLLGAGAVVLSHLAPFPMLLDVTERTVWRMPHAPDDEVVYLTYDDGPNPAATPALLDVLAAAEVPATFFVIDRHLTAETAPAGSYSLVSAVTGSIRVTRRAGR